MKEPTSGDADSSREYDLDWLRDYEDVLLSQLVAERSATKSLRESVKRLGSVSRAYAREYRKVINSRLIKTWLGFRKISGKEVKICTARLPKTTSKKTKKGVSVSRKYLVHAAATISASNGSAYYHDAPCKFAIIADDFNKKMLDGPVDLVYVNMKNYRSVLQDPEIEGLIYASCWRGDTHQQDDLPPEIADFYGKSGLVACDQILRFAQNAGVPIIFMSTEDPVNFKRFCGLSRYADVILTSDAGCIASYEKINPDAKIGVFPFSINPAYHNPIGMFAGEDASRSVLFAGAWYSKFPQRVKDAEMIFSGIIRDNDADFIIYDRFADNPAASDRRFPAKYAPYIDAPVPYDVLQKAHKAFDWTVNLNSVVDSETMCAMRVYEVQALGGLLLSNYALSVSNAFPGVFIVLDSDEVPRILGGYSDREVANMQIEGVRRLYRDATVYDRLNEMFEMAGVDCRFPSRDVYVVGDAADPRVAASVAAQTLGGAVLVDRAEAAERLAGADGFVAMWGEGFSNEHHLEDMVNAFKFTDVGYVCYVPEERWRESYDYIEGGVAPDDALFDLSKVAIADVLAGGVDGLQGFGVLAPRWGRDTSGTEKDLAVIVPVYNNGAFLSTRCFRSLLRSSAFDRMRVYLVDDGSTDGETQRVVRALERDFDNVVAYLYDDGGSGSASRPRNKGLEMSTEPYVTFLDPDNEAVGDGYARLMEIMEAEDVDLAFGTVPMVSGDGRRVRSFSEFGLIDDPREALVRSRFFAQSMQGGIVRRELLDRGAVRFAPGIGQDTLFFYELMAHARRACSVDIPVHVYFAERANSAVNAVSPSFFRRSLECERATAEFLEREGLMGEFRRLRLDDLMRGWYGAKLGAVRLRDVPGCAALVAEIGSLYGWEE